MKYLCLVYLDAAHWNACSDQACAEYVQQLAAGRRLLAAEPLHGTHTATTVRVRNGEVTLFDGPYAETKEMLAGFYLVEARDLDEAIQLAAAIPPAQHGSVEVRPVRELRPTGDGAEPVFTHALPGGEQARKEPEEGSTGALDKLEVHLRR